MKQPPNTIGQRIREHRLAIGRKKYDQLAKKVPAKTLKPPEDQYTQGDLARDADCAASQVSEWESGKVIPGTLTLGKLARALGVRLADLVGE